MLETEKAYIAGIIDGEGSIMLTRLHKNQYHSPCVSIASTDSELLQWVKVTIDLVKLLQRKIIMKKNIKILIHIQ